MMGLMTWIAWAREPDLLLAAELSRAFLEET
jgi:hypothetical protein